MTPLRQNVADLLRRPGSSRRVRLDAAVSGLATASARAEDQVSLEVVLESVLGGVVVRGSLGGVWIGECSRCLQPLERPLRLEVDEVYRSGGTRKSEEADTYPMSGDEIDLELAVRDLVLLELPGTPLCDPSCRGLCTRCGSDLNTSPCRCVDVASDPRFGALSELRLESRGA